MQSLKELPNRFSTFQDFRQKFLTPCSQVSSIGYSLQKAVVCLPPRMNDGQCHYRTLEDMMLNPRKLQHHLTADIAGKQSALGRPKEVRHCRFTEGMHLLLP